MNKVVYKPHEVFEEVKPMIIPIAKDDVRRIYPQTYGTTVNMVIVTDDHRIILDEDVTKDLLRLSPVLPHEIEEIAKRMSGERGR